MNTPEFKAQLIRDDKSFSIILYDRKPGEEEMPARCATISFFKDGMMMVHTEGPEVAEGVSTVRLEGLHAIFPALEALESYISEEPEEQPTESEEPT